MYLVYVSLDHVDWTILYIADIPCVLAAYCNNITANLHTAWSVSNICCGVVKTCKTQLHKRALPHSNGLKMIGVQHQKVP